MTYKSAIFEMDNFVARMEFGIANLGAVQAAMAEGALGEDEASNAIYGAFDHLHDICKGMRECIESTIKGNKN